MSGDGLGLREDTAEDREQKRLDRFEAKKKADRDQFFAEEVKTDPVVEQIDDKVLAQREKVRLRLEAFEKKKKAEEEAKAAQNASAAPPPQDTVVINVVDTRETEEDRRKKAAAAKLSALLF